MWSLKMYEIRLLLSYQVFPYLANGRTICMSHLSLEEFVLLWDSVHLVALRLQVSVGHQKSHNSADYLSFFSPLRRE